MSKRTNGIIAQYAAVVIVRPIAMIFASLMPISVIALSIVYKYNISPDDKVILPPIEAMPLMLTLDLGISI